VPFDGSLYSRGDDPDRDTPDDPMGLGLFAGVVAVVVLTNIVVWGVVAWGCVVVVRCVGGML
jgi:hypothetical protein